MLSNGPAVTGRSGEITAMFDADHLSSMDEFYRGRVSSRLREKLHDTTFKSCGVKGGVTSQALYHPKCQTKLARYNDTLQIQEKHMYFSQDIHPPFTHPQNTKAASRSI